MTLIPQEILDRVERIFQYHQASKYTYAVVKAARPPDPATQPDPYRVFADSPKVALPSKLLDAPVFTLSLLGRGLEAVPESQLRPPQDLRTLASWLYLANGLTHKKQAGRNTIWTRTCPSDSALYPCEIYVAAFGMRDLEPGLYHYSVKEFSLRKLREGADTLARIKRGRPDLEFLKTVPVALLVSTIFCRTAWKFRHRAYRHMMLDAGHQVESIVTAGTGLGIQTLARLTVNDKTMRELIGVPSDAPFGEAEAAHALVVWTEQAERPLAAASASAAASATATASADKAASADKVAVTTTAAAAMPPIKRPPLASKVMPYEMLLRVHIDCVAPGVAVRSIKPPLTELTPLPQGIVGSEIPVGEAPEGGWPLRQVLLERRSAESFSPRNISRDQFLMINGLAFRGATYHPMQPADRHLAFVRPFWVIHGVTGMDPGIWYYDPPTDHWLLIRRGEYRVDSKYLCIEQGICGDAAAVCFMAANIRSLLVSGNPDTYRLAHLEAGIACHRMYLAAAAQSLACCGVASFYDDESREFFGLQKTGWEIVYVAAVGSWQEGDHADEGIIGFSRRDDGTWRD
jgi:SagB-type dehydrogenase family enzyme